MSLLSTFHMYSLEFQIHTSTGKTLFLRNARKVKLWPMSHHDQAYAALWYDWLRDMLWKIARKTTHWAALGRIGRVMGGPGDLTAVQLIPSLTTYTLHTHCNCPCHNPLPHGCATHHSLSLSHSLSHRFWDEKLSCTPSPSPMKGAGTIKIPQ